MVRWIITDIDGCISPEESIAWDLERFGQLARIFRQASVGSGSLAPITLCTGRPQPYVEALMKLLDVRAPAICENGAVIYTLHDNTARWGPGVTEEKIRGLRQVRAFLDTEILPAEPAAVVQFGKEAQISVFSSQPAVLEPIGEAVANFNQRRGGPELVINRSHFYLNISLAGVDKGQALLHLLRQLDTKPQQAAAIGDTEGDLPLQAEVGFFACPANATPGVKAVADYVSPYPQIEGMLDILQRPEMQLD
jgi:hydroxymethylpyrimidine pyrophosphatase-like HAD family hydrolase